jgi:hypothetical protein
MMVAIWITIDKLHFILRNKLIIDSRNRLPPYHDYLDFVSWKNDKFILISNWINSFWVTFRHVDQ